MNDRMTPDMNLMLMQAAQGQNAQNTAKMKAAQSSKEMARLEETAKDFEAVFLAEMMKPMFEGISTEAPFGGGRGEEVFRGMLIQEYGKMLSQTGNVGIADSLKQEMIKMQEAADSQNTLLTMTDEGTIDHE